MLSARIRKLRVARGLSQSELAKQVGIGRSAVANWECGDKSPSCTRLQQVALVLGVSFEWLATGRGRPALGDDCVMAVEADIVDDPDERKLLHAYRVCSKASRRAVLSFIASTSPKARRILKPS